MPDMRVVTLTYGSASNAGDFGRQVLLHVRVHLAPCTSPASIITLGFLLLPCPSVLTVVRDGWQVLSGVAPGRYLG